MTSVGTTGTSPLFQTQRTPPPRGNPVAQAISRQVSTGSISSADGTALSGALASIDASLESGRSGSGSGATRLDPSQIRDRIGGLIDDQVSSGSLTGDQAETLRSLFEADAPGQGRTGAASGPGGPPPGPPPAGGEEAASSSTESSASLGDLLDTFMTSLQASQSKALSYASSGTTSPGSGAGALLFDFTA